MNAHVTDVQLRLNHSAELARKMFVLHARGAILASPPVFAERLRRAYAFMKGEE